MLLAIIGVSYAAFSFSKAGNTPNKITTGSITMSYDESDNTMSITNALPTTDTTGYKRLKEGEYFDFSVTSNIQGDSYINYEISAKEVGDGTIDGKYIKLYLSKINDDGTETPVTPINNWVDSDGINGVSGVPVYNEEVMANNETGRPAGEMSLATGTIYKEGEITTNYRLRMWVSEDYNPQGDGGGLNFTVQVNVYGKNEAGAPSMLKTYGSNEYFWSREYRSNITSIVTKGDTVVPEDAIESWNMSTNGDNSIVAYVEDDGRSAGTYKLTIGGNSKINANPDMSLYFRDFTKLETIDLTYLDTSLVENMYQLFFECSSLDSIDISTLNTSNVTNMERMFYGCSMLKNINFGNIDTSNVTNMSYMFTECSGLETIDLTPLNTSNVTDMSGMFSGCSGLETIDLTPLNTSKVTSMGSMFSECSSLTTVDVSALNTSNVTNMGQLFYNCSSLTTVNFGNIDTSSVIYMDGMFYGCSGLVDLDLSNFDTSNVKFMGSIIAADANLPLGGMFQGCTSLKELDLRSFDTHNVTNMFAMFYNTSNLTKVLVDDAKWSAEQANTGYMFEKSGVSSVTFA